MTVLFSVLAFFHWSSTGCADHNWLGLALHFCSEREDVISGRRVIMITDGRDNERSF